MKLLLTSMGITNKSIEDAFLRLVGKPASDIKVAFVPTAANEAPGDKWWLIKDLIKLTEMGTQVDIVDIAVLPLEMIKERIKEADVLFFEGGSDFYLMHWIKKSGFVDMIEDLLKTKVWVGVSSGSIITGLTTSGEEEGLYGEADKYGEPKGLKIVSFETRVHLGSKAFPNITKEKVKKLAEKSKNTIYALDDNSAIVVDGDKLEVISEGKWEKFEK